MELIVARTDETVVAVTGIRAFPQGSASRVSLRLRHLSPRQQQQLPYLFEGMSGSTRRARAHCCAARPSTPRCSPSGASSATRARSKRSSSGAAARRPSRWRVSLSACRPRSSACSASGHATICSADVGHGASVFTGDFLALQHPASELAACLGHATAFPSSDYAGSAPPGAHSRRRAYPPPAQPPGRRATPDGSHCNDPGGGCGEVPGSRIWQTVMCRVQLSCRLPARFSRCRRKIAAGGVDRGARLPSTATSTRLRCDAPFPLVRGRIWSSAESALGHDQ